MNYQEVENLYYEHLADPLYHSTANRENIVFSKNPWAINKSTDNKLVRSADGAPTSPKTTMPVKRGASEALAKDPNYDHEGADTDDSLPLSKSFKIEGKTPNPAFPQASVRKSARINARESPAAAPKPARMLAPTLGLNPVLKPAKRPAPEAGTKPANKAAKKTVKIPAQERAERAKQKKEEILLSEDPDSVKSQVDPMLTGPWFAGVQQESATGRKGKTGGDGTRPRIQKKTAARSEKSGGDRTGPWDHKSLIQAKDRILALVHALDEAVESEAIKQSEEFAARLSALENGLKKVQQQLWGKRIPPNQL